MSILKTLQQPVDITENWLNEQIARSARDGISTVTVVLTPDLALALLTRNPDNRVLSRMKILEYAREISAGRWEHNGTTLIVSSDGKLNDGQHRCEAVIEAGKPITTQITFGVPRETRHTLDVGLKRTVGSHLALRGYTNTNHLTVMVGNLIVYERLGKMELNKSTRPTVSEVMAWLEANPNYTSHLHAGELVARRLRASAGLFAALSYLFAQRDAEAASRFFDLLCSGENLTAKDPVFKLRELLLANALKKVKLPPIEIAARTIKAWNLWRRGATTTALQFRRLGDNPEHFPTPE